MESGDFLDQLPCSKYGQLKQVQKALYVQNISKAGLLDIYLPDVVQFLKANQKMDLFDM